jgi:hypothetical protein
VDVVGIPEILPNLPFVALKERDWIQTSKEIVQSPPFRPFQKHDIKWIPHVTTKHALYNHTKIVVVPWDRLKDFVQKE